MSSMTQSIPFSRFSPVTALHPRISQWCVLMLSRSSNWQKQLNVNFKYYNLTVKGHNAVKIQQMTKPKVKWCHHYNQIQWLHLIITVVDIPLYLQWNQRTSSSVNHKCYTLRQFLLNHLWAMKKPSSPVPFTCLPHESFQQAMLLVDPVCLRTLTM